MSNQDSGYPSSEVMYPATSDHVASPGAMVPLKQPFAAPSMPAMGGGYTPAGPEILHGQFNQTWLMNCLRRRWLLAMLMGMLMGAITAGCLLLAVAESSSVTAYLRVKSKPPSFMGETERLTSKDIELFAQTQLTLLKGHFVLKKALGRDDINQLNAVQKEGSTDDAVQWMLDELRVSYPGEGEILEVRFDGAEDPLEMVKVVDAILVAFRDEVLQNELNLRNTARESLKTMHQEVAADLKKKMKDYETLAEQLGDKDSDAAVTEVKMLMSELNMIRQQEAMIKNEMIEIEVEKSLAIQSARSPLALDARVQEEISLDPTIANYENDLYGVDQQIRLLSAASSRETSQLKRLRASRHQIEQQMEQYRMTVENKIRQRLKGAPNELLSQAMIEYSLRKKNLDERALELEQDSEAKTAKIQELGQGSTVLSIKKADIELLQELAHNMEVQIRNGDVDDNIAEDRIRVVQDATPSEGINFVERYSIAGIGGILAFLATCYAVAMMEFQRRRLNEPADVEEGLGIRVLGVLPSVASRKALAAGSPVAAQVSESIDNVRATLMHDSTSRDRQVLLVTSPVTMEGSTTVASHLAVSLSRAGRRTLLIDGDLREPSLHKLFGLPLDGGFSEVLRSEIDAADAVRPTSTEGLWLLTAGMCDMDAIHALATDQLQPVFEKLRAEFDFIVIDGAPVLGLSDMLSLGQQVDGAILTVLRDHSEIRKVYQAAETLKGMGIRLIGSVVNGVPQKSDRRVAKFHQAAAKRALQLPASTDA